MGTVTVIIAHAGRLVDKIPTVLVIDISIPIIIIVFITLCFISVTPDVVGKIGVCCVDTGVEYGNYRALGVYLLLLPKMVEVDGLNVPLLPVKGFFTVDLRVVTRGVTGGCCKGINNVVRLGILYLGERGKGFDSLLDCNTALCAELKTV